MASEERYEERWYEVDIVDRADLPPEPDWSKVPEERIEVVRAGWNKRTPDPKRWRLWGPQIPLYARDPQMQVTVIGLAPPPASENETPARHPTPEEE